MFSLWYIEIELLKNSSDGIKYFDELEKKYPDDILTWQAKLIQGEIDSIPAIIEKEEALGIISENLIVSNNYPNPFNPTTIINYSLPNNEKVVIKVYDILGREIAELVNEQKMAGKYTIQFDGSNLSSGVYFYSITAGNLL